MNCQVEVGQIEAEDWVVQPVRRGQARLSEQKLGLSLFKQNRPPPFWALISLYRQLNEESLEIGEIFRSISEQHSIMIIFNHSNLL